MQPFFSIIIPTLNEELFLPLLLKDLDNQKEKNFEVIVVDSFSEDKTKFVVKNWNLFPISFYQIKKRNVSIQRNHGANHSKGKYLVFLDADSRITKNFTLMLQKEIIKNRGLFYVPSIKTDNSSTDIDFFVRMINFVFNISQYIGRPFALGGAMIIESNYFQTIKGFDEKVTFGEDYDLAKRSFCWGVRGRFLENVSVTYSLRRIHKEGKLNTYFKYILHNSQYILKGRIDQNLAYEMGGHLYKKTLKKDSEFNILNFKKLIHKAKRVFRKLSMSVSID